jgi:hypothetical protein
LRSPAYRERLWDRVRFSSQNSVRDLMHGLVSLMDTSGGMAQLLVDSVIDYAIYLMDLDGTIRRHHKKLECGIPTH